VVIVRGQPQVVNVELAVVMEQQAVTVKEEEAPNCKRQFLEQRQRGDSAGR